MPKSETTRNERRRGGWRYQPVITTPAGDPVITMIEVYFNDDDTLNAWTEDPAMVPQGETAEELSLDLVRMLIDCWKWKPVQHSDLRIGMTFEHTGINVERMIAAMEAAKELQ